MTRVYFVHDEVVGYGHQLIKALLPPPPEGLSSPAALPGPRIMHGADAAQFQTLRNNLEREWVRAAAVLSIPRERLPGDLGRRLPVWAEDCGWRGQLRAVRDQRQRGLPVPGAGHSQAGRGHRGCDQVALFGRRDLSQAMMPGVIDSSTTTMITTSMCLPSGVLPTKKPSTVIDDTQAAPPTTFVQAVRPVGHARDAGDDRHERAHHRHEARDHDRLAAVPLVELLCEDHVLGPEEAPMRGRLSSKLTGSLSDEVRQQRARDRGRDQDRVEREQIELAGGRVHAGRHQQRVARQKEHQRAGLDEDDQRERGVAELGQVGRVAV
jgi:hypothetical protein